MCDQPLNQRYDQILNGGISTQSRSILVDAQPQHRKKSSLAYSSKLTTVCPHVLSPSGSSEHEDLFSGSQSYKRNTAEPVSPSEKSLVPSPHVPSSSESSEHECLFRVDKLTNRHVHVDQQYFSQEDARQYDLSRNHVQHQREPRKYPHEIQKKIPIQLLESKLRLETKLHLKHNLIPIKRGGWVGEK